MEWITAPTELAALFPANSVGHYALSDFSGVVMRAGLKDPVMLLRDPARARQIADYAGEAGVLRLPGFRARVIEETPGGDVLGVDLGDGGEVVLLPQSLIGLPEARALAAELSAPVRDAVDAALGEPSAAAATGEAPVPSRGLVLAGVAVAGLVGLGLLAAAAFGGA